MVRQSAVVEGMWLLNSESLLALDALVDEELARITADLDAELDKAAKRARDEAKTRGEYANLTSEQSKTLTKRIREDAKEAFEAQMREQREVSILCRSQRTKTKERCAELLQDGTLTNEIVDAITLSVQYGTVTATVRYSPSYRGFFTGRGMHVEVFSDLPQRGERFYERLLQWAHEEKAPRYYSVWRTINPMQWVLAVLIMAITALGLVEVRKDTLKSEGRALVNQGLKKPEDQLRATELILSIVSDAPPKNAGNTVPSWLWSVTAALFLLALVLTYAPKGTIGIGKGAGVIARRNAFSKWAKWLVVVILLTAIIPAVVANFLTDWVKSLFQ